MEEHQRWSSLPDDIVFKIISHLNFPKDQFVITISTTIFSIKQLYGSDRNAYNVYEPCCWTIFDNLFNLFTSPVIATFYLSLHASFYKQPLCWPIIDTWAKRLRARNIRHFTIKKFGGYRFLKPVWLPSIFRMHSLLSLTLYFHFKEISWTDQLSMVLLPNLKKLHLVSSNYGLMEELISRCPSLEDLSLILNHDPQKNSISITSKKLKRLYINLHYYYYVSSSILNVILDAPILEHYRYVAGSILSMEMLDSILNVKSLALRAQPDQLKFYNSPKKTVFPNLSHLTLSFPSKIYLKIFDEQLLCCPNLKVLKLHFIIYDPREMILNEDVKFVLLEPVKRLEVYMNDYQFSKQMANLVIWLLRSAKVLEKLVLSSHDLFSYSNSAKSQFFQTLFECVESTLRCQIELLGGYKLD
ncbi:putative F-box/FBD/LRR-repeat protein At5g44950 [Silene latifolia]|uniref:putative F-box/FBD/LRR-repeat protein At5g44950 n=1 Tax=Silene latifolia TaxID=37657 RepID=UPI003D7899B0